MRVLITHDKQGNILALAVPAPDAGDELSIEPQAGDIASELDVQVTDPKRPLKDLDGIVRDYRVDLGSGRPTLVKKRHQ